MKCHKINEQLVLINILNKLLRKENFNFEDRKYFDTVHANNNLNSDEYSKRKK